MFAGGQGPVTEGFLDIWNRWDTRHFMTVADLGWVDPDVLAARPAAFFPLYPLAIRALSAIGFAPILAGLLISTLSTWVACAYLIKLADEEIGGGAGRRAALYLLLFPTAVFLVAPYSEALFIAGAIPAFYYARRARWLAAALPAAVASATRAAGMFLIAGLVFEYVRQAIRDRTWLGRRLRDAVIAVAAAAAPIVAFGTYLWLTRGTAMQYFIDQREGWGRNFPTNPIVAFQATWNTRLGAGYPTNWIFAWRIEILAAIAGILLTIWAALRKEWGYTAYMGLFMVSLMMSSWYFSIPRMLLSFFPVMVFLADATKNDERRHELALVSLAPIATLGVILFTRGAWFF
jgi:Gpi18-like mannosyltransferase